MRRLIRTAMRKDHLWQYYWYDDNTCVRLPVIEHYGELFIKWQESEPLLPPPIYTSELFEDEIVFA